MSGISRIKPNNYEALGLNEWGEREIIPNDIDSEIIETNQEFQGGAIDASKIKNLNVDTITVSTTGYIKSGKDSFTDSTNAGYYFSSDGVYIGAASDATYLKYDIGAGTFTIKATIDGASTIGGRTASTLATAIDASGHFADDAINTASSTILDNFTFGTSGALQIGEYVNGVSGDIKISPSGILGRDNTGATTFSINGTTGVAVLNGLVVGTNVGLGTAQDSAGVTTIIGDTVTTGFVNALNVNAATVSASISITSPTITGGTITIGTGDSVFISGASGIQLGDATFADAPFSVNMSGDLIASSATITGALTTGAGSSIGGAYLTGAIGAWNITANNLRSGSTDANSNVLLDGTNSILRLGPTTGDYLTLDGVNQKIESSNYSTGVSGFTIDPNLIEAENIIARGTMKGVTFAYDQISAIGGQLMVANADTLASDMTALDASTLIIKGDSSFAVNDFLQIKGLSTTGIDTEWLRVTALNSGKNNGTVSGGVTIDDGAMVFDNVDTLNKIYIPDSDDMFEVGDLSFSIWINPDATTERQNILCHYNWRFFMRTNKVCFGVGRMNDGAGPFYSIDSDDNSISIGNWYHLVGIYHPDPTGGNGYIKFYLDNNLIDTVDIGSDIIYTAYGSYNLQWGNSNHGVALPFDGAIGTTAIYSKILTAEEIEAINNAGRNADSPITDGLIAQYSGRRYVGTEASPTSIIDTSPPSYTVIRDIAEAFTADNNPAWKAGTPVVKQGAWSATTGNKYTAPVLTGGTDVVLSNFETLRDADINGKFSVNIDGVDYNNLEIDLTGFTDLDDIATLIQTAIRAETGREETVVYDTDKFIVSSTGLGEKLVVHIGKFTEPTINTGKRDISGAGYLDLGDNATPIIGGYGSGGWLRLIGEGTNSPYYSVFKRLSGEYNDYVETCRLGNLNGFLDYTTDEYGIAIGDANGYLKYDPTNGLDLSAAVSQEGVVDFFTDKIVKVGGYSELTLATDGGTVTKTFFTAALYSGGSTNNYAKLTSDASFNSSKDFALGGVLKFVASAATPDDKVIGVFGINDGTSNWGLGLAETYHHACIAFNNQGEVYLSNGDGSTQTKTALADVTITNYNNYKIVKTSTSIKAYVNGVLKATHTTNLPTDTTVNWYMLVSRGTDVNATMTIYDNFTITQAI